MGHNSVAFDLKSTFGETGFSYQLVSVIYLPDTTFFDVKIILYKIIDLLVQFRGGATNVVISCWDTRFAQDTDASPLPSQAVRPQPTPCRQPDGMAGSAPVGWSPRAAIPEIGDATVAKPTPGKLRVSSTAVEGRLKRIFTPNVRGEFKVSQEIVQQWKSKKGRRSLEKLFQSVGYSPDWCCKKKF